MEQQQEQKMTLSQIIVNNMISNRSKNSNIGYENKKEAYLKMLPHFGKQDQMVFIAITLGYTNADMISAYTGILITSVRRSLCGLKKNGYIMEVAKVRGAHGAMITEFAIQDEYQRLNSGIEPIELKELMQELTTDKYKDFYKNNNKKECVK